MNRHHRAVSAIFFVAVFIFSIAGVSNSQEQEGRLLRFPSIYKDKIVFSYGGDLWLVPSTGGVARRITTHPGLELFPKFSPDGKTIAFTAQYDGNFNVYVIPSEGGEAKQLTFLPDSVHAPERMGPNNQVLTWMPDGKSIVFLSRRDTISTWFGRPFTVPVEGGLPVRLPIDKGGLMSFSPDGNEIAYNRIFRNFRTWKRYRGGMQQQIAFYNFKTNHYEQVADLGGNDSFPMWHGDIVYFNSDRGPEHRMNLYAYDLKTEQIRQLTHFTEFDVNWPSLGPDSIVFENGGYLYGFDFATETAHKITVYLPGDRDLARKHWENTSKWITAYDISPEGNRAVFSARGDVYTVPAKEGSVRNLTQTPGIREKDAVWSPDGRWIAYLSDRSGEDELYLAPQDGMGKEIRITTDGTMFRLPPVWSPDSKKLAYADKSLRLFYVDIDEKKPVLIDQGKYFDLTDYSWSPDSRWVAYANATENLYRVTYLYSLSDKKSTPVTTSFTDSWNPVFDPDGKYLYFISTRDYNEVLGVYDFEFANPKAMRVYAVTLRADTPSPFAPQSDEVVIKSPDVLKENPPGNKPPETPEQKPPRKPQPNSAQKNEQKTEEKPAAKPEGKNEPFKIDLDGLGDRIVALPIPPGSLQTLGAAKGFVYYVTAPVMGLSGPVPGEDFAIHVFDMKERKDQVLVSGANGFALSFDGKKLLYSAPKGGAGAEEEVGTSNNVYGIIDAAPQSSGPHKPGDGGLNLSGMRAEIDPPAEWKQMFFETYRQERDYFFEPAMNGVDWAKERDKYAQLLPYVADRYDLTYVLGEFIGELGNSHTYVGGGDYPDLHPIDVGVLGVDFEADAASGFYRLKKIYPGENWNGALRSPLTEPGVNVKEGDYVVAVNGRPLRVPQNPYELFVNTAGDNVTLTVNSKPAEDGARNVVVKPISSEFNLHQLDWIETNRRRVDQATNGRVGYVYLPDMEGAGLNEFVKQFFPQIRKEGMIIDVRYNGGGFVDQLIFERLRRILAGMDAARNFASTTVPDIVFHGPLACVTNEYAASDGDIFTYFFKYYKIGPVIGMRTWGGVRGIRGEIPLLDGGYITRPEFSRYGLDSEWVVENHGVDPDIVVDNTPDQVMSGHDPQLEKAIEVVMKEINENPQKLPSRPPDLPAYPPRPSN
ncbi:MAG: PDZ domain-containing protein [Candidatus Acidiferrales bacterium]|jgi:tricorn protease